MTSQSSIYRHIFEFSPSPMAIFALDGECLLANRAFFIQLGFDMDEDEKHPLGLQNLFHQPEALQNFRDLLDDRHIVRRWETRLKTRENDSIPVLLSGRTLQFQKKPSCEITFTNITQLEKLQKAIRRSHDRVASLIENLTVGLFLVNRINQIADANTALGNLIHLDPRELEGSSYQTLFSRLIELASEPVVVQHTLQEAVRNVIQRPEIELKLKAGQTHLELKLFPVWDERGQSLGWGGLIQDVTEMREQTAWKLELLSMLAHDLRTPLATLKGHATALLANYQNWGVEMGMEFLKTIDRSVDELIRQVDRNLALTRVETGRLGLRPETIDPMDLIHQAIERAAGILGERKVALDLPDNLPQIRVDPARTEEVLINLLDNAARYSSDDTAIQIRSRLNGNWLHISVIDQGPGIPSEKKTKIFEKYVRGEYEEEGTGLGLYICRKIVEAHGGRIWVESPPSDQHQGAAFTFTLPIMPKIFKEEISPEEFQASTASTDQSRTLEEEKILVVEDETDVQTLLYTILSQEGYQVQIASDGPTALDIIQVDSPNLVLLDWMMPGMRGLQVCRNIRRWSNIPIIMVTSKKSQADLVAALDAGVDDYVTKPFQTEELLARIRALIRRGEFSEFELDENQFIADGLRIDFGARGVWLFGEYVPLTPTEYQILVYLVHHRGLVLTYDQLIEEIWGFAENLNRHRLFVLISRLREKLESDPKHPHFIQTKWGIGYVFLPQQ
ncbi:MAG: response regulator [Anaerolineales bacterium]